MMMIKLMKKLKLYLLEPSVQRHNAITIAYTLKQILVNVYKVCKNNKYTIFSLLQFPCVFQAQNKQTFPNVLYQKKKNNLSSHITSSSTTQCPALRALSNGPSLHANWPPSPPSTGKSAPNRSVTS